MIRAKPNLEFCKNNITHIISDFNKAVRMGYLGLNTSNRFPNNAIYALEKYEVIKKNKSTISRVRKNPDNLWMKINKEMFCALVDVLYDHRDHNGNYALTLWDNAHLYRNQEAIYHSKNHFYKSNEEYDIAKLVGKYRTFKMATNAIEYVLGGILEIELDKSLNILTTKERCVFEPKKDNIAYNYNGTIHYHKDQQSLIWEDVMEQSIRHTRLFIRPTSSPINMEGFMFLNLGGNHFVRMVLIDNEPLKGGVFTEHYTSDKIPEKYRELLKPKSLQKFVFSAFI